MEKATVEIGEDVLEITESGNPFGEVWLLVGDVSFPTPGWTDFVTAILATLARAAASLLDGTSAPIDVPFMEGPFYASIGTVRSETWHIDLWRRGRNERQLMHAADVDGRLLSQSIVRAAERVLEICYEKGWISGHTDRLEVEVQRLRSTIPPSSN